MKDIIEMAREAGFTIEGTHPNHPRRIHGYDRDGEYTQELEAFAALVEEAARDDEREECAKLVKGIETYEKIEKECFKFAAKKIKERGTT